VDKILQDELPLQSMKSTAAKEIWEGHNVKYVDLLWNNLIRWFTKRRLGRTRRKQHIW